MAAPTLAYLAEGRLFLQPPGGEAREVSSAFVRDFENRQAKQQQLHGWKSESQMWGEMGMMAPRMDQWNQSANGRRSVKFRSLSQGAAPGELTYLIDFGNMTGLFQYDPAADQERRLFHRNSFPAQDLARHPHTGRLAMSVAQSDGTKRITICEADGGRPREVTLGDAVDEMPRWLAGEGEQLIYQSAGIGRDDNGFATILGPYAIQKLDLKSEAISTLFEHEQFDYLQPAMLADGSILCVRRPYKHGGQQRSVWAELQDIVLIPYRLARAGFYFLNFFSVMFSGQPLRTAGGPERPVGSDTRMMSLWGQMVDTRRQMAKRPKGEEAGLVPKDWELVQRSPAGEETVIARGVLTFDVHSNGDILYSDGRRVWLRTANGDVQQVSRDHLIERVLLLG